MIIPRVLYIKTDNGFFYTIGLDGYPFPRQTALDYLQRFCKVDSELANKLLTDSERNPVDLTVKSHVIQKKYFGSYYDNMTNPEGQKRYQSYKEMGFIPTRGDIKDLYESSKIRACRNSIVYKPPGDDHGCLFVTQDRIPAFYLSQPYGVPDMEIITDYCYRNGLYVSINPKWSYWYPGHTDGIMYYRDHALCPPYLP